jgi:hypothetical protein
VNKLEKLNNSLLAQVQLFRGGMGTGGAVGGATLTGHTSGGMGMMMGDHQMMH